ncbi:MAG: hypothetical protein OEY86_07080 [Nitrospira sp.]|nr:hypothetical protein [Nitrospira sp.]
MDEIAGREWDRLVTERQGRPRTMSLHHETLLLTAAAQAYRYGWAVGNLARQLGISAPDLLRTVDKDLSASYASLCGALGCSVANPLLRDS